MGKKKGAPRSLEGAPLIQGISNKSMKGEVKVKPV